MRRHTWDNTGSFYIRVRGHNDAFDDSHPFTLLVTVVDRDCSGDSGVTARLTNAVSGAPIAGKTLVFSLGRGSIRATTAADGSASADVPVLVIPASPPPRVSVEFAEDTGFLGSSDHRDVNVHAALTAFVLSPSTVAYGDAANTATLVARLPSGDKPLGEVGVHAVLGDGRQLDGITDGFGRVLFDTLDFEGVQPGTYTLTLRYAGNERYAPTSVTFSQIVVADGDHSLALSGRS